MQKTGRITWVIGLVMIVFLAGQPAAPGKIGAGLNRLLPSLTDDTSLKIWIFFTDKGRDLPRKIQVVKSHLTQRSLLRRMWRKKGALVDYYDVPVSTSYIQQILPLVEKLFVRSRWLNAVSVQVKKQNIPDIISLPFVKKVEIVRRLYFPQPDVSPLHHAMFPKRAADTTEFLDYGLSHTQIEQIQVDRLHAMGYNGQGILICMLDAGFNNLGHVAFQRLRVKATWDFVNGDAVVWDEPGQMGSGNHGTYTLSALGGYAPGFLIGPAYGATFLLAKTENTDYERHVEEDNWVAGAEWADSLGADIISSSLGYRNGFSGGEMDYTWEDMNGDSTIVTRGADIAASRGILVVNSAGNEGPGPQNTLVAPADGDSVVAVGAVDSMGNRAPFSSVGPTADGRIKPDVMAMGVHVVSASAVDSTAFVRVSGTSLSCPLASGAAALVWQVNPRLSNMQVFRALKYTASRATQPDNFMGWGILNAYQAAFYYTPKIVHTPLPDTLLLQDHYSITATITSRFPLKVDSIFVHFRYQDQPWQRQLMQNVHDSLFQATIPGPSDSGQMQYYLQAVADSGTALLPSFAPDSVFTVTIIGVSLTPPPTELRGLYLYPLFPNPFNNRVRIVYYVPALMTVQLRVFNGLGQLVETLVSEKQSRGVHQLWWDGSRYPSGVYYIELATEERSQGRKAILIK